MSGKQKYLDPYDPASENQRSILKTAIQRGWIYPNPFEKNYERWKNLTAGEADNYLVSMSRERLGALEEEFSGTAKLRKDFNVARPIGQAIEGGIREIGRTIDGGF